MKTFILTSAFIFLTNLFSQPVFASTFVGNGGNVGDIELQMTLGQAKESFSYIERDKDVEGRGLCVCTQSFEGRPLCDVLKQLNQEQIRFCSRYIELKAGDLARVLSAKDQVSFSWTHDQIEVQDGDRLRGADAVTNPKNMSMTLNQKRFLDMDEDERVFLIGHELFHLTSYQGNTLSDEGDIGPFKGVDGGRKFINAMAATVVMQAHEYSVFSSYRAAEIRSKSYKKTWVNLSYSGVTTPNDTTSAFDIDKVTGTQLGVRYQFTQELGALAQLSTLSGTKAILTSSEAKESRDTFSLGGAYRWFPFRNPLTFSGQSHFVFSGTLDAMRAKYEIHDPSVGTSAEATSTGYTLACNYFIPFNSGLWAYAGVGHSSLHYSFNLYNQVDVEYKNNGTTFALGASYGF